MGGSYVLLVDLAAAARIRFGAAGPRDLAAGTYAYAGSARGPGGFARLERHREVASGERTVGHWHVDHLLGHREASVVGDRRYPPAVGECDLAAALQGEPVPGVGSTDCRCGSHLLRGPGGPRSAGSRGRDGGPATP